MDASATDVEERIRAYVAEYLLEEPADDADALADGRLDSLAIEELIAFVEEEFGVRYADEELVGETFAGIAVLAASVQAKRTSAPPPTSAG